jgi:hypothetical protein
MASLINDPFRFENPTVLSRIFRVINVLGLSFTSVRSVVNCVFRFVTGVRAESLNSDRPIDLNQEDDAMNLEKFSTCIDNMNFMHPEIFSGADSFTSFNEFCLAEGLSYSAVFVSERDTCRFCNGKLVTNPIGKDVIVYHMTRGTYLGSRFTKNCRKCRIQEHYGFYNYDGKRMFNRDCLSKEFLLSTEETAIDLNILRYLEEEIVYAALPFQAKANVYNSVHGYSNEKGSDKSGCVGNERTFDSKTKR